MSGIRFASLNARGLNKKSKRYTVFNKCKNFDVVCLQETYITDAKYESWKRDWPGDFLYTPGSCHSKGQIILINKNLKYDKIESLIQNERFLGVKLHLDNMVLKIINVYAPNPRADKLKFIQDLYSIFNNITKENTIICGDFNIVLDNDLDICAGLKHDADLVKKFNDWVNNSLLLDAWRLLHADSTDYTWSSNTNPHSKARRLDYIFFSENLLPNLTGSEHCFISGTDHKLVSSSFTTDTFKRGKSFWKFNTSLLKDLKYVTHMNEKIDDFLASQEEEYNNPAERFEFLKAMVKSNTMEYSKVKNKLQKDKEQIIQGELKTLDSKFISNPNNTDIFNQLQNKKRELELIQIHKTKGAITRAREQVIRDDEKNTKYFLNLEKHRGNANTILSVTDEENNTVYNEHSDILKTAKKHFETMSKKDERINGNINNINEYLNGINHPILGDEDKESLEAATSIKEFSVALSKLNNDSAPGIDGIPIAFYKVFWSRLKKPFFESINYSLTVGELSTTQKRGIITLFHKGKELRRDILKNWRPITLTNTDYKIFSKMLAIRMQKVLSYIINLNQSGFLKGRSISDHIRTLDDIICVTDKNNKVGMIVSLDFAKAFDSIDHSTILGALKKFNFGENFISMVKTLMENNVSCVQNGGWLSGFFKIERGIKQGCCVSPLLFLLVAEIMAIKIRNNVNISGFTSANILLKILQYCDDTTLILKDENELAAAIGDIDSFYSISGLKLNKSKSVGMWIGRSKHNLNTPGDIKWVKLGESIKVLGIYFNAIEEASNIELNWTERIEKIKRLMKRWQIRETSLYGKIIICKTHLLSQMSYVIQSLSLPQTVLTELDTLFFKFIWQKKITDKKVNEKIKRSVICKDYCNGGLNMIRIKDQQRVFLMKWLEKSINPEFVSNLKNVNVPDQYFSAGGGIKYYTSATTSYTELQRHLPRMPRFWKNVIETWLDIQLAETKKVNLDAKEILQEPLFNNNMIRYKGSSLNFKPWIRAGITHIHHIFERGNMLTKNQILNKVTKYGGMDLDYNAMYNSIPVIWKNILSNIDFNSTEFDNIETIPLNLRLQQILKLNNKEIRNIIGDKETTICGRGFWRRKLDIDILDHFKVAINSTQESRLRILHFKILHNIYPSNILLFKMKIKDSQQCDFCGGIDYIEHMFIHCPRLRGYWENVFNVILARINLHVTRSVKNILFGLTKTETQFNVKQLRIINHIILIAKMCISKTKANNTINTFMTFENELSARQKFLE